MVPFRATSMLCLLAWLTACGGSHARSGKPRVIIEGTSISIVDSGDETVPIQIPFQLDSASLVDESRGVLDVLAEFLNGSPELAVVEVQGHSDERGGVSYNTDLSRRRAEAVMKYLIKKGVAADRLKSEGYGASKPAARGTDESAWGQNRRVEFVILSKR